MEYGKIVETIEGGKKNYQENDQDDESMKLSCVTL
jgi:hypothetical protein